MNYYEKYLKYKQKYLELKGAGGDNTLKERKNQQNQQNKQIKTIYQLLPHEWKNSRYSVNDFVSIGKTAAELKLAKFSLSDLKTDFNIIQLKAAGFNASDFFQANFNANELKYIFTASELKAAGYKASDIKSAGYRLVDFQGTPILKELRIDTSSVKALKDAGFSSYEILENDPKLKNQRKEFTDAGFTEEELTNLKFSA
jgi:hypothetical protein